MRMFSFQRQEPRGLHISICFNVFQCMTYTKEERLDLQRRVAITVRVHELLREASKQEGVSMAKIVCNLVLEKYDKK